MSASAFANNASQVVADLMEDRERFLRFVERRVHDPAMAEDLLQSAYMRAVAQSDSLRDRELAKAWFYRMLRNAVIDYYRHRAVENRVAVQMPDGFDAAAVTVEQLNICGCMDRAVDRLKPEYAEILREVELAGGDSATVEAYAQRAGITPGNAAVRAYRARKAMAKSLTHTCGSCAGAGCLDCTCVHPRGDHQG
jgi:RNA polymerase sigma-70 factor (ECF subfamily)